jgi:hypothetical protein
MLKLAALSPFREPVMSEKSFAVASVSVAIVWGTFFYPPSPQRSAPVDASAPISAEVTVERLRIDKGSLLPKVAPSHPVVQKTALNTKPGNQCVFDGVAVAAGCPSLHKLAGE